jgi:hypothetical protein
VRPKPNFFTAARRVTDKAMALASSSNWFGFMVSPFCLVWFVAFPTCWYRPQG